MRRLFRWLLILAVVGLVLLAILWWAAPSIAAWYVRGRLPAELSAQARLTAVGTGGPVPTAPLTVTLRPADVRAAAAWRGVWIPPLMARPGQWLSLTWRPSPHDDPLPAVAVVGDSATPAHAQLRISPERLSTLISGSLKPVLGYAVGIRIDSLSGVGGPGRDGWTMPIEASGVVRLTSAAGRGSTIDLPVQRFSAIATVRLRPAAGGLHPEIDLRVVRFDTGLPSGGTMGSMAAAALPTAVQVSANAALAEAMADVLLPAWVPEDATCDLRTVAGAAF
jgi:hypothetical protein